MTEKENRVRQRELDVRKAESRLHIARVALEHGHAKAKAEFEEKYATLKSAVDTASIELESERAYLELAKTALEQSNGFEEAEP